MIIDGQLAFVDAIYQKRCQSEALYLRPRVLHLLSSIGESKTENIILCLSIDLVSEKLIDEITELCKSSPGKHELKLKVVSEENEISMDLKSKKLKVHADSIFVERLGVLGISYRLN